MTLVEYPDDVSSSKIDAETAAEALIDIEENLRGYVQNSQSCGTDICLQFYLLIGRPSRRVMRFSPFEFVYGRTFRGSMWILKELWVKEGEQPETKAVCRCIFEISNRRYMYM